MPQIDIASFIYQVLSLLLFLLFFFFYLDKIILYFFFDIKKLRFFLLNSNLYWITYLDKYNLSIISLQYNKLIKNVYFFLNKNITYIIFLCEWIELHLNNLIINCLLEYNYLKDKYLILIQNYSFFEFLNYFNIEEDFNMKFITTNDVLDYTQYFYDEETTDIFYDTDDLSDNETEYYTETDSDINADVNGNDNNSNGDNKSSF